MFLPFTFGRITPKLTPRLRDIIFLCDDVSQSTDDNAGNCTCDNHAAIEDGLSGRPKLDRIFCQEGGRGIFVRRRLTCSSIRRHVSAPVGDRALPAAAARVWNTSGADPELVSRGGAEPMSSAPPLPSPPFPIPPLLPSFPSLSLSVPPLPSLSFPSLLPFPFPSLSSAPFPFPPLPLKRGVRGSSPGKF